MLYISTQWASLVQFNHLNGINCCLLRIVFTLVVCVTTALIDNTPKSSSMNFLLNNQLMPMGHDVMKRVLGALPGTTQ